LLIATAATADVAAPPPPPFAQRLVRSDWGPGSFLQDVEFDVFLVLNATNFFLFIPEHLDVVVITFSFIPFAVAGNCGMKATTVACKLHIL